MSIAIARKYEDLLDLCCKKVRLSSQYILFYSLFAYGEVVISDVHFAVSSAFQKLTYPVHLKFCWIPGPVQARVHFKILSSSSYVPLPEWVFRANFVGPVPASIGPPPPDEPTLAQPQQEEPSVPMELAQPHPKEATVPVELAQPQPEEPTVPVELAQLPPVPIPQILVDNRSSRDPRMVRFAPYYCTPSKANTLPLKSILKVQHNIEGILPLPKPPRAPVIFPKKIQEAAKKLASILEKENVAPPSSGINVPPFEPESPESAEPKIKKEILDEDYDQQPCCSSSLANCQIVAEVFHDQGAEDVVFVAEVQAEFRMPRKAKTMGQCRTRHQLLRESDAENMWGEN